MDVAIAVIVLSLALVVSALALRRSEFAVVLAVGMFGLEQIISGGIDLFQREPALYNYLTGGVVLLAAAVLVVRGMHARLATPEAKASIVILYCSGAYFWLSLLWSPSDDPTSNLTQIGYFLLFVVVLPLCVSRFHRMLGAWVVLWGLIAIGALGFLVRFPIWDVIAQQGRLSILVNRSEELFGNPLALADLFVYLVLISALLLFLGGAAISGRPLIVRSVRLLAVITAAVGSYLVFLTSRGEMLVGIMCLAVMAALVFSRSTGRAALTVLVVVVLVSALLQILLFSSLYDTITWYVPRYSGIVVEQSVEMRSDLVLNSLELVGSSAPRAFFGIGAKGCETVLGLYPHSSAVQAIVETGAIGTLLFVLCNAAVFVLGIRTLRLARANNDRDASVYASFLFSLFLYSLVIGNKKGSLANHDSWMWLAVSTYGYDSLLAGLRARSSA